MQLSKVDEAGAGPTCLSPGVLAGEIRRAWQEAHAAAKGILELLSRQMPGLCTVMKLEELPQSLELWVLSAAKAH